MGDNISECLPKVWWVQCKPFPSDRRYSEDARKFQKDCIEKNFFGMGWNYKYFEEDSRKEFSDELAKKLKEKIKKRGFTAAQKCYGEMQPGDVVLARLNDEYYVGRIAERPRFMVHDRLTWSGEIRDGWKKIGDSKDLPAHVWGKLQSANYRGTVAGIDGLAAFTVMKLAGADVPKQKIGPENFCQILGDGDLEDLMALYMTRENPGYILLPSSCKKNTPGVEYVLYHSETGSLITCQTKNNSEIDVSEYSEECYQEYEKVYLFSGKGYTHRTEANKNIVVVERLKMYKTLLENVYLRDIAENYCEFEGVMDEALKLIDGFRAEEIRYINPTFTGGYVDENPLFDVDIVKNGVFLSRKEVCVFLEQKAVVLLPE